MILVKKLDKFWKFV